MRYKKLGLPKAKEEKLAQLKEKETICKTLVKTYQEDSLNWQLEDLNSKIEELTAKRDLVVKRKAVASSKLVELNRSLNEIRKEQLQIITQDGILAKYSKAVKAVKTIEGSMV